MYNMDNVLTESTISGLFQSIIEIERVKPYKICVDFDRRFYIWTMKILPGRLLKIKREGTAEYIYRMIDILFINGNTLINSAIRDVYKGNMKMFDRIYKIDNVLKTEMMIYLTEIDRLKLKQLDIEGE